MATISIQEVGLLRFLWRWFKWRLQTKLLQQQIGFVLPTGIEFQLPADSPLAKDIYITRNNIDGNAAFIVARYLQEQAAEGYQGDFFDIGANIGYYTALFSPLVRRTYAFEPDLGHHVYISPLIISTGNARLIPQAVSNFTGPGRLFIAGHADHSHLVVDPDVSDEGTAEIEVTTLDEFCRSHPDAHPSLIKVDAEGFEVTVLEGAIRTTNQFKPIYYLEFPISSDRPNHPERLQNFLSATKYCAYTLSRPTKSYVLQPWQPLTPLPTQLKAIFLAPSSDRYFQDLARKFPSELQTLMTPRQVHQYLDL